MTIYFEGIKIELTPEQISKIEKVRKQRHRYRNNFVQTLKLFGFKKMDTSDWLDKTVLAYENELTEWYAEIWNHLNYTEVWIVGKGLPHASCPPGGGVYGDPEAIQKVLAKALDENDWK